MNKKMLILAALANISLLHATSKPSIDNLKTLKHNADTAQKTFMNKVETTTFKNEEFRKLFLLWLDTIKNKMAANKKNLQKQSDEMVAKKLRKQGKTSDENNIEKMAADIKWLSIYYEIINTEMIPYETIVLEAYQNMDHIIAPEEFTKRFKTVLV